jgi:hypothetical protein
LKVLKLWQDYENFEGCFGTSTYKID